MRIAIIGLGAVGSWCSANISKINGLKDLLLIDRDIVEEHNLKHQNYAKQDIGIPKAEAIADKIKGSVPLAVDIDSFNIADVLKNTNLVLDCTDNLETRLLVNDFCLKNQIPWIYSGAVANAGSVALFTQDRKSACFQCVFGTSLRIGKLQICTTAGVFGEINKQVAEMQANIAADFLSGKGNEEINKNLFYLDSIKKLTNIVKTKQNPKCNACKGQFDFLENKKRTEIMEFCGNMFQIKPPVHKENIVKEGLVKRIA